MNLTEFFKAPAEPIMEGGNMFPDVEPFEHERIPDIMQAINGVLAHANARAIPIGSGATPTPGKVSGDLDMIVDQDALSKTFNISDPKLIRKKLRAMFDEAGLQTGQSGVSVHVRAPVGNRAHQVDIMVVPKGENAAKFHTHNIPPGSPYKGVNKHIALAVLAKKRGYLWSPYQGLFKRDEEGKKGAFATDDIDQIAEMLLGKGAAGRDLGSVESILAALPPEFAAALLDELKADPAWPAVKESVTMKTPIQKPAPKPVAEAVEPDPADKVTLDIPLLIRIMEYAKEDAKTDMDLHSAAERMIELAKGHDYLCMDNYDDIVGGSSEEPVAEASDNTTNYLVRIVGPGKKKYFIMPYKPGLDGGNPLHLSKQIESHPITQRLRGEGFDGPTSTVVAWRGDIDSALADAERKLASGNLISSEKSRLEKEVAGLKGAKSMMGAGELAEGKKKNNPYAIGMAAAMKATGDKPPLKKSTINKAHKIAKSVNEWSSAPPGRIFAVKDGRQLHLDFPTMPGDAKPHHFDQALRQFQSQLGLSEVQRLNVSRELGAGREVTVNGITFGVMRRKPQEMR